jgi:hypothetical protein
MSRAADISQVRQNRCEWPDADINLFLKTPHAFEGRGATAEQVVEEKRLFRGNSGKHLALYGVCRNGTGVHGLPPRVRQLRHDDPAMDEVWTAHNQTRSLQVDENGLHCLRRYEGRPGQGSIRNARVIGNSQQSCVLGGGYANRRELRIKPLPEQMLSDFQTVANPAGPALSTDFSHCNISVLILL